jgi:hypothetical protein
MSSHFTVYFLRMLDGLHIKLLGGLSLKLKTTGGFYGETAWGFCVFFPK